MATFRLIRPGGMMHRTISPTPLDNGMERLLDALEGVISSRVVADADGELVEVHILATPELHPKQVVRNVESALCAGLGVEIDRRIVSVAQLRPDEVAIPLEPGSEEPDPAGAPSTTAVADAAPRVVFVGYDARRDAARRAHCQVTLRRGENEFTGVGRGADTVQGRAEAAARATIEALAACHATDRLGLEGVALVDDRGRDVVLVAAQGLDGRRLVPLTGAARIDGSAEEAAILATLQATNRWQTDRPR